jgi:hypothetical protein
MHPPLKPFCKFLGEASLVDNQSYLPRILAQVLDSLERSDDLQVGTPRNLRRDEKVS